MSEADRRDVLRRIELKIEAMKIVIRELEDIRLSIEKENLESETTEEKTA